MSSFDEVQFPVELGYGSSGGPEFLTDVHESAGGREERTARRSNARHIWNAAVGVKDMEDLNELKTFFYARQGANRGFRFKDPQDYRTGATPWVGGGTAHARTDVEIGTGDGSTTTFQLIKKYTSGTITRNRTITKPVSGTVLVELNGVSQTEGSDFTVNTTTGIITFSTAPPNTQVIKAGFEFDTPSRFLNDDLETNFEAYDSGTASVPIVEILEDTTVFDDFNWGGHLDISMSADYTVSVTEARSYSFDTQSSGHSVVLQDKTNLPPGGPYFYIHNEGSTHSLTIKDDDGSSLVTLPVGNSVTVILAIDASLSKLWIVF